MEPLSESALTAPPGRLAQLLTETARAASPSELAAEWHALLSAPGPLDLDALEPGVREEISRQALAAITLEQLFQQAHPNEHLLTLVKDFARRNRNLTASELTEEVASALYYVSIAAGLARCGMSISRLSPAALRQGLEWVLEQPWLDSATQNLVREGLAKLG